MSRYAKGQDRTADALADDAAFADDIAELIARHRIDVLIPVAEASVHAILDRPERFADVTIPFPDACAFRNICRKDLVLETGARLGIEKPKQFVLEHPDALDQQSEPVRYPVVLKPNSSVVTLGQRRVKTGVQHVRDSATLRRVLNALPPAAFPVLLQERIQGPGVGVFLLIWDNQVIAAFSHRRIREKPPSGGVSVDRESIPADPDLLNRSIQLLQAFNWRGVAMVEYKVDRETGIPHLMEINGRFWGSLQLALDAGVDFPALLIEAALGRNPEPVLEYRTGVRTRWFWGDVDQLLLRLTRSRSELALPDDEPGRLGAVRDFLGGFIHARGEVFRMSDPAPALFETWNWARGR